MVVKHNINVRKLQEHGLMNNRVIHQTEVHLAKSLRKDIQEEMSEFQLEQFHKNRSKEMRSLRSRLQKAIKEQSSQKIVQKLETSSIQKMRSYEKTIHKQITSLGKSIHDTHRLILFEQEQTTHDVATVLTFLTHVVHVIELNLSHGELARHIPREFKTRLELLLSEALQELTNIEDAAKKAILTEFSLHGFLINRGKALSIRTKDLAGLIQERAQASKRLQGRVGHLKGLLKELHNLLGEVKVVVDYGQKGVYLPELTDVATSTSVNLGLFEEALSELFETWPPSDAENKLIQTKAKTINNDIKNIEKKHKSKGQLKILNSTRRSLRKIITQLRLNPQKIATKKLLEKSVQKGFEETQDILAKIAHSEANKGLKKHKHKHKKQLFKNFTKTLNQFETKTNYFYNHIYIKLQNTTDIIKSSLTIQQQLSLELHETQKYVRSFYKFMQKEHNKIAKFQKSKHKKKIHSKFSKEMLRKEKELTEELKKLYKLVGRPIGELIKEIPEDRKIESRIGKSDLNKIHKHATSLSSSLHHATAMLGAAPQAK